MAFICPECGAQTGEGTGEDAMRHVEMCLHVTLGDLAQALRLYGRAEDMHGERVYQALQMAAKDGGQVRDLEALDAATRNGGR